MFTTRPTRNLRDRALLLAGATLVSVALVGCSASAPTPSDQEQSDEAEGDSPAPAPASDPDGAAEPDEGDSDGLTMDTEGVETACDAVFLFSMGQAGLILGPTTGGAELTQDDIDEVFGVLEPYVPQFSDDLAAAHSTYLAAAAEATGQDASTVVDIFARDEVVEAQHSLRRGLSTECADW